MRRRAAKREQHLSSWPPRANGPPARRSVVRRTVGALVVFLVVCVVVDACFVEPDDVVLEVASIHANVRAPLVVAHLRRPVEIGVPSPADPLAAAGGLVAPLLRLRE